MVATRSSTRLAFGIRANFHFLSRLSKRLSRGLHSTDREAITSPCPPSKLDQRLSERLF